MFKKVKVVGISLAMLASLLVATANAAQPAGDYIVIFDNQANEQSEAAKLKAQGANVSFTYSNAFKGLAGTFNSAQLAALQRNPRVKSIEADAVVTASVTQTSATWGIDRIDQTNLPLSTTYSYTATGSGVKAYVIDTGIYAANSEFEGRVIAGFNAIKDRNGTNDCNGHGTHVAGTIGGKTFGVAKKVSLVPVRVLDCRGSGTNSGVIAGIDWVIKNHAAGEPAVANMSLGGGVSSAIDTAVANLVADGVVVAVAAGNSNVDACTASPARAPLAITVGATGSNDGRASYSNFGSCLDIFAPGSSITSAWIKSTTATNTISGTSMASPHVAGVAALYLSTAPTKTTSEVAAWITANAVPGVVISAGTGSPNLLLNKQTL